MLWQFRSFELGTKPLVQIKRDRLIKWSWNILVNIIYLNLFSKNKYTHVVCILRVCKFEKLYFICTLRYAQDIFIPGRGVCAKKMSKKMWNLYILKIGLWVFSILPICWKVFVPIFFVFSFLPINKIKKPLPMMINSELRCLIH